MNKNLLCLILSFLLFSFQSRSQEVITLVDSFPASGGVKLGPDGNVYIGNFGDALSNANGTQVWRYLVEEDSLEVFATGLQGASGNDFGPNGNLYQSNIAGNKISKITPNGQVSDYALGLSAPVGVVSDGEGRLYVCECGSNEISVVDTLGNVTLLSDTSILLCPNGITMDFDGNLYISNFNNSNIIKMDTATGEASIFAMVIGNNNGHLTFFEKDSLFYVASQGSSRIYTVDLSGNVSWLAGSGTRGNNDGTLNQSSFSRPNGIALSEGGDTVYINSCVPITNVNFPLNPSKLRAIVGLVNPVTPLIAFQSSKPLLYPNPTRNELNIKGLKSGNYWVKILNSTGKVIYDKSIEVADSHDLNIDLGQDIDPGLVFINLSGKSLDYTGKILISK